MASTVCSLILLLRALRVLRGGSFSAGDSLSESAELAKRDVSLDGMETQLHSMNAANKTVNGSGIFRRVRCAHQRQLPAPLPRALSRWSQP